MKSFITGIMFFAGASLFMLNSCKKSDTPSATPTTVLTTINGDPSLTIFSAIESHSGDDNFVNSALAIVVPVDSAFTNAGITTSSVASLSQAACDSIVRYYSLTSAINLNDSMGKQTPFPSDLGVSLYADSTSPALYFNGIAAISSTPTVVGTTSIYKLSKVLYAPETSISQITTSDTTLSLFNEAINRTNLTASLSGQPFTLFMPSNSAFMNAGYPSIASIDSADINMLTKILMYQVVPNDYFANDLASQTMLTTLQGGTVQVSNSNGIQLLGNSDSGTPATLLNTGILAGNVLTYKINTLLLP